MFKLQYTHGCRQNCFDLPNYIGRQERSWLESRAEKRDNFIQNWVSKVPNATYEVISDCHDFEYSKHQLDISFKNIPVLSEITDGYMSKKEIHKDDILISNEKMVFIAVVQGHVPGSTSTPIMLKNVTWTRNSSAEEDKHFLVTSDTLKYLVKEHDFQITDVDEVFFYKKCNQLSKVYQSLTEARKTSNSESEKCFLKSVVNFSCGFFGLNEKKNHNLAKSIILSSKLSSGIDIFRTQVEEAGYIENKLFFFSKTYRKPVSELKISVSALPIFVMIVEYGKNRLSQILCFFDKFLKKDCYRLLYSNVDNGLIALSTDSLDDAVIPELKVEYIEEKVKYLTANQVGHAKEEFKVDEKGWKFASAVPQNYAILCSDENNSHHKNSSLSKISSKVSYDYSCNLLDKIESSVQQERRKNKLLNIETEQRTIKFDRFKCDKK